MGSGCRWIDSNIRAFDFRSSELWSQPAKHCRSVDCNKLRARFQFDGDAHSNFVRPKHSVRRDSPGQSIGLRLVTCEPTSLCTPVAKRRAFVFSAVSQMTAMRTD